MRRPSSSASASRSSRRGELIRFAPSNPEDADYDQLADTLLAVATDVAAAQERLKREALAALDCGDTDRAKSILRRWLEEAPSDIVASL